MESLRILLSVFLLFSFSQHALGRSKKWLCEHGGRQGKTEPFFKTQSPFLANLPCRYKMANVACGGDQTEVYVEKKLDANWNNNVYMTAVVINITTTNSDGSRSYQQLRLDNLSFKQYLDKKQFTSSPWEWSCGSTVADAKKVTGRYDEEAQKAEVTVGKLTILFTNVMSWQRRRHDKPTLEIMCSASKLKAFESYPATVCGGPKNSQKDVESVVREMQLDHHHDSESIRDAFALFTKQHVQQREPLCMEMKTMVQAQSSEVGEHMYDCNEMFTSWSGDLRKEYCEGDTDRFKLYVTCMHVLAKSGKSGAGNMASAQNQPETCELLQQAAMDCKSKHDFHLTMAQLLHMAGCPSNETMAEPKPVIEMHRVPKIDQKPSRTCKAMDVRTSFWNRFSPGDTTTFFGRDDINIELPCMYKMANVKCGGVQSQVFAQYALDSQGRAYVSLVKAVVTVRHNLDSGLVLGNHFNRVTNKGLKKYIKKKMYKKDKSPWNHKRGGGPEPEGDNRILHTFDRKTNTAVLTHRNLTVTYKYIDVSTTDRSEQDVLTITCNDPKYKAEESFPHTVCGGRNDAFSLPDDLVEVVPADPHHKDYNNDILILAKQEWKQEDPLCAEAKSIVNAGGEHLGDILMECFMMYRTSPFHNTYGRCMRKKKIDPFKFYVTCLRVLTGATGCTSRQTCDTLKEAHDACGSSVDDPHMEMSKLLQQAQCTKA